MEGTFELRQASLWFIIYAAIASAWVLAPLGGLYLTLACNALLGFLLIIASALFSVGSRGKGFLHLSVLPLARMASLTLSIPLAALGLAQYGPSLTVAIGSVIATIVSNDSTGTGNIRFPRWDTLLVIVGSCAAGLFVYGSSGLSRLTLGHGQSNTWISFFLLFLLGLGVEWAFRGWAFEAILHSAGPIAAIVITSALGLVVGTYGSTSSMVVVALANVSYGFCKSRGEQTLWIGVAHGLLSGFSVVSLHL